MESNTSQVRKNRVLCVDLDGTLIRSDMLLESLCHTLKRKPWSVFQMPFWLMKGRAHLKQRLAEGTKINAALLPYHVELLEFLKAEHQGGRKIALATASDESLARSVAEHLGIFSEVHASNGTVNLKGKHKLSRLIGAYGDSGFDYAGNESADLSVWERSAEVIIVGPESSFRDKLPKNVSVRTFPPPNVSAVKTLLRALRVHQWVKNLLLFVPLLMAHRVADPAALSASFVAFICFCLCSSSVYVLNDLFDLESDREHHSKRRRPFASGELPLSLAFFIVPIFLLVAATLSLVLPIQFTGALIFYFLLTLSYSLRLKQIVLVDILVLASLYTIRILAGGEATEIRVSEWLLAFSMFFFLSLACVKRFSELFVLRQSNKSEAKGRGYVAADLEQIAQFGSASGYLSILVLALYVSGKEVAALYSHPGVLWLGCPLLLYWISRVWLIAHRGKLHDDPIVFAIRDRVSYIIGAAALLLMLLAL